jgi:DNA-binding beta-propeller fold protein YncE
MKSKVLFGLVFSTGIMVAAEKVKYEVWSIDQSNSPGKTFGGILYIWKGNDLQKQGTGSPAVPEKIDLSGDASALCLAKTAANPVRPHMIAVNPSNSHAIISFVASGHVLFLNAQTRKPVECIRTSVGFDGARQVHFAIPSPDETYVSVANQNGKLFERINTDYAKETFVLDTAAGINLATCVTPNGVRCEFSNRPDNAPICPIVDSTSRLTFVTLRGGGLFVVDSKSTPMKIVGEYDTTAVSGNGCLGAEVTGKKMYLDSGAGSAPGNPFSADLYAFPVTGYSASNPPNTPERTLVFREEIDPADAHGAVLVKDQKYLWVADRGRNFIWVVDTETDKVVNRIYLPNELSPDPTPDLLMLSPKGKHVFMSLRGPAPLTADPHVSTGITPGVGVIKLTQGGRHGIFESLAPMSNIDAGGVERADGHGLVIRVIPK